MEEFKKKIKDRIKLCTVYCSSAGLLSFLLNFLTNGTNDFSRGIVMGVFCSTELVSIVMIVYLSLALKDEKKLKDMYIKSTDERNLAISKETMRTASVISLMTLAIAVIVSGFFSVTVSLTLFAVLLTDTFITCAVKLYYNRKM